MIFNGTISLRIYYSLNINFMTYSTIKIYITLQTDNFKKIFFQCLKI